MDKTNTSALALSISGAVGILSKYLILTGEYEGLFLFFLQFYWWLGVCNLVILGLMLVAMLIGALVVRITAILD